MEIPGLLCVPILAPCMAPKISVILIEMGYSVKWSKQMLVARAPWCVTGLRYQIREYPCSNSNL